MPESIALTARLLRVAVFFPLFLIASGVQYECHRYLYSLKRYTLPTHPLFKTLICPHYTAECLVYLSLTVLAAPVGYTFNKTIFTALILVLINLGVTSEMTRDFYAKKFGPDAIRRRWRMVPFFF